MEELFVQLKKNGNTKVLVNRKKVKNVRLKVFPDCKVSITVPINVSEKWVDEFVNNKSKWIDEKLSEYRRTLGVQNIDVLKSGMSIKLFGVDTLVIIRKSKGKDMFFEEGKLFIDTLNLNKQHIIQEQFEKYMKEKLEELIDKKLKKHFYIIKKEGYDYPEIYVRKMKTMWGNCNPNKNKITINLYLYQASSIFIEYVILHELLHYIHPNHSKEFYELLNLYMPDWKERKRKLDYEVISYID